MDGRVVVRWRQLDRYLWVGIADDGHLGTIELGRRYTVLDTEGRVRGRCRTLDRAMALLTALHEVETGTAHVPAA